MDAQEIKDIKTKYETDIGAYVANKLQQFEDETGYSPKNISINRIDVTTFGDAAQGFERYVTGFCKITVSFPVLKDVKVDI
jgi:hypothetical protein